MTSARQKSGTYDYDSYKPKHHFCIDCAFKSGEYKRGEIIYTGFGDPGSKEEAIAQCYFCGVINTVMQPCFVNCEACKKCFVLMGNKREVKLEFSVDHEPILEIPFALGPEALGHYLEDAMTARMEFRLKGDPVFSLYDECGPEDLLRIVGEKLLEEDEDEWDAGGFCVGGLHCPNAAE